MFRNPYTRKKHIVTSILAVVGLCLLVAGGLGVYDYIHRTQTGVIVPDAQKVITTTQDPSEKKPTITNDYTVAANQPRLIQIPTINVKAYVQKVGITNTGAMATPNNIYFTGWYTNSVAPGEKGVSIINGHVGGRYNQGIFVDLKSLKPNDDINVQMGDLTWRNFKVVTTESYTLDATASVLFQDDPKIDRELHLITCDGVFDSVSRSYDKRVVVIAKYIS